MLVSILLSNSVKAVCELMDANNRQEAQLSLRDRTSALSVEIWYKRSKNFDKRANRGQKILRRSQDGGKAADNGLSRC